MSPIVAIAIARLLIVIAIAYFLWSQILRPLISGTRLFPYLRKERREGLKKAHEELQATLEDLDVVWLEKEFKKAKKQVQDLREQAEGKPQPTVSPQPSPSGETPSTDQKVDQ